MFTRLTGFVVVALAVLNSGARVDSQSTPAIPNPTPLIREEQRILMNGIREVWRLEWKSLPVPACSPDPGATSCPCIGFAYGESGQLDLIRLADGREVDRLPLTPLFEKVFADQDGAIVQRWEPRESDIEDMKTGQFAAQLHTRPVVKVMHFGDYNHDGQATEFFLQTGVEPCGKRMGVVVGLTPSNPRLHAFGSVVHPNKPLVMRKKHWDTLLKTSGPTEVLDWPCGDHGSETETDLKLQVTSKGIQVVRMEYECREAGGRGRLLRQEPL